MVKVNELIKDFISIAEERGDIITVVFDDDYSQEIGYEAEEYDELVNMILQYGIKSVLYDDNDTLIINTDNLYDEKITLYI